MKKKSAFARPYAIHYYYYVNDPLNLIESKGACKTEVGARRAVVVRLVLGQYEKAVVINRDTGEALYHVKRRENGTPYFTLGNGFSFAAWKRQLPRHLRNKK